MTKRFIPSMDDLKELRHDEDGFRF
jgi:hypothetical protein